MKRYAALKLLLPGGAVLSRHVVEVDTDGRVLCCYPLREEIAFTQWLPGVLMVAPPLADGDSLCNWDELQEKIDASAAKRAEAFVLYHIPVFDLTAVRPLSASRMVRL